MACQLRNIKDGKGVSIWSSFNRKYTLTLAWT